MKKIEEQINRGGNRALRIAVVLVLVLFVQPYSSSHRQFISCYTEDKTLCPKEYNKGIFRKEYIGL